MNSAHTGICLLLFSFTTNCVHLIGDVSIQHPKRHTARNAETNLVTFPVYLVKNLLDASVGNPPILQTPLRIKVSMQRQEQQKAYYEAEFNYLFQSR